MVTVSQTCGVVMMIFITMVTADPYYTWPTPPKWTEKPHMARYLAHYANWGTVSAFSPEYKQPFGTIQSFSDGPLSNSSGVPYFYISSLSDTYKNIQYDSSATLTMSLAESNWCKTLGEDPEEPTCARVTLVGQIVKLDNKEEMEFAELSLMSKLTPIHEGLAKGAQLAVLQAGDQGCAFIGLFWWSDPRACQGLFCRSPVVMTSLILCDATICDAVAKVELSLIPGVPHLMENPHLMEHVSTEHIVAHTMHHN